jgi:hypothetical protein
MIVCVFRKMALELIVDEEEMRLWAVEVVGE